jgi:energy-coupling factor transporter ATP-binding protein EcfA2
MKFLEKLDTFGEIAAEDDDAVLEYFLSTEAVKFVESGKILLVLGRKGSGKTALVTHFTKSDKPEHGSALSLRSYPWGTHSKLIDKGASETEAYVASWRLLIAIRLASSVVSLSRDKLTDSVITLKKFLKANFGTTDPQAKSILSANTLKVEGFSLSPQFMGNSIFSIDLRNPSNDDDLGVKFENLTEALLKEVSTAISEAGLDRFFLHFDELDQGIETLDQTRKRMIVGLILAARSISNARNLRANISPIVYLRTDIWEQVDFSDKNKISRTNSLILKWDKVSLKEMVEVRLKAKLGEDASWENIDDGAKMRGTQTKFDHILARTFLRPRDVIQFLNEALTLAKDRDASNTVFQNSDINDCRQNYSEYLKEELADEIKAHWPQWEEALSACSRTRTITFSKEDFNESYEALKGKQNPHDAEVALQVLWNYSVIGYQQPLPGGGSTWIFRYSSNATWDPTATRMKVHVGLKEYANLKEERAAS